MTASPILVRLLQERDIPEARRILRLAFGTHLGLANPEEDLTGADYIAPRLRMSPESAFVAESDGRIVGSNFATRWGSVGFFGPLTVDPEYWNQGVGQLLLEPVMQCFEKWQVTHTGLFTFSNSSKHIALYQKFGFWPRFLTALMTRDIDIPASVTGGPVPIGRLEGTLPICARLTDAIYSGLNLETEIRAAYAQNLGETVLIWDQSEIAGFAVCHCGRGSEAGEDHCLIKFGAAKDSSSFNRLLDACEGLAASRGIRHLDAGMNLGRHEAYRQLLARGFRSERLGVAMHRPNEPGYSRPGIFVIDDWR